MESARRTTVPDSADEAAEFIRFCYRRRRTGWPELYDEMCAVAGRGLFRGWGSDELAEAGIGLSLRELPALSALAAKVIAEETADARAGIPGRGRTAAPADRARPEGPMVDPEGSLVDPEAAAGSSVDAAGRVAGSSEQRETVGRLNPGALPAIA